MQSSGRTTKQRDSLRVLFSFSCRRHKLRRCGSIFFLYDSKRLSPFAQSLPFDPKSNCIVVY